MKTKFTLIALLVISLQSKAQIQFKNTNLIHPDSALMYLAVPNFISIEGLVWKKDIFISSSIEGATFDENHLLHFVPQKVRTDSIMVYKKGKLIAKKVFETKQIPDPIFYLGNLMPDKNRQIACNPEKLNANPNLRVEFENCDYKMKWHVNTYRISILDHEKKLILEESIGGSVLTFNQMVQIKQLKKGSKIILDSIKIFGPEKTFRILSPIEINII